MSEELSRWYYAISEGWKSAVLEEYTDALNWYKLADSINLHLGVGKMAPEQCLLRHKVGEAEGVVQPCQPNEDVVVGLDSVLIYEESYSSSGQTQSTIDYERLVKNLKSYKYDAGYHLENIKKELPHIMVLSTGRCGTVSLYRLFERSQYLPYHGYFFNTSMVQRFEMMCRHMEGDYNHGLVENIWCQMRAAEWLGAISVDRPMVALNHMDTIFAPLFSQIHPKSKFIYLRRDPKEVFKSFYSKKQWNEKQLTTINYSFTPEFKWRRESHDLPYSIVWYLKFTEAFSRAFGEAMGDRFIEISANDLFEGEVDKLCEFTEIDLPKDAVVKHFSVVHNEKAHKAEPYDPEIFERVWYE